MRTSTAILTAIVALAFDAGLAAAADAAAPMVMKKVARPELGSSAAFSAAGRLHAVARQGEHVVLYASDDEGRSWSAPVIVNAVPEAISADGENRPKLAFAADGALLVSWTKPMGKPFSGEIRLARSEDGQQFSAPITVHRDRAEITHRFESLLVVPDGRILAVWIDKRDLEAAKAAKRPYRGAALYSAVSRDGGRSFEPETKVADHSCECCRIATAVDRDGAPLFMWRHVFAPNERDHAIARLGDRVDVKRATFDRWKLDGCPHHGPSLAVDDAGVRHAVWFNQKDGAGRVFYGRLPGGSSEAAPEGQRPVGGESAERGDIVASGQRLAIVWKEFDGQQTRLWAEVSADGGRSFESRELAATDGASDQPRALRRGEELFAFWRTEKEGMRLFSLAR